jgi:hypothetical protein
VATSRQLQAAKQNVKKAERGAAAKKTIASLPESTRRDLGREGAKARQRHGDAGHALEDGSRQQLYDLARQKDIPGRSKMGKWDLIEALRKAR